MKTTTLIVSALFASLFVIGCGPSETPTTANEPNTSGKAPAATVQVAYDLGTKKAGDKGHCCVCSADGIDHGEEALVDTIDYEGKTYGFCNNSEKAKFISEPAKYAKK